MEGQRLQIRVRGQKVSFTWNEETRTWRTWTGERSNVTEGTATDINAACDAVRKVHEEES